MILDSVKLGLIAWGRRPLQAAMAGALLLGLLAAAYALAAEVSPVLWLTLLVWLLVANLLAGGWWAYCLELVAGRAPRWRLLAAGVARPWSATLAGAVALASAVLPAVLVYGALTGAGAAPPWARVAALLAAVAAAPPAALLLIDLFAAGSLAEAARKGLARARRHWFALVMLLLAVAGFAAAGPMLVLLVDRALPAGLGGLLPLAVGEYGPGFVRTLAIAAGLITVPLASCVLVAATLGRSARP